MSTVTEEKLEWRAVKAVFKRYKDNELYLKKSELPQVTEEYQLLIDFNGSDVFLTPEYTIRIKEAKLYNSGVIECVNRLAEIERKVIVPSYLKNEYIPPWQIYEDLAISRAWFYRVKARAIGKLHVLFQVHRLKGK